jgi:hypothetical protein
MGIKAADHSTTSLVVTSPLYLLTRAPEHWPDQWFGGSAAIAEVRVTVLKRDWHRVEAFQEIATQCSSSSVQRDLPPPNAVRPVSRVALGV